MITGYFTRATEKGHKACHTMVHLVVQGGNPLCRYRPHKTMKLQWVAMSPRMEYVECKACRKKFWKVFDKLPRQERWM
jgi:hypothetical protein